MYKISDYVINFIMDAMEDRKDELATGREKLTEVKIQSHLPGRLTLAIMSLNYIHVKCTRVYKFIKSLEKLKPVMYNDDIKIFASNEKE